MKLLIVDDEPLILIGMRSMLTWKDYGVELCGTVRNGSQALELIEKQHPEIVITDIKMPLMTGLELAHICRERYGELPIFIMPTSYEEFSFVKEAMHYGAVEYLVKLELSPQGLANAVERAVSRVNEIRGAEETACLSAQSNLQNYCDKFFVRLYNNLFESNAQYLRQKEDLQLDFSSDAYAATVCTIDGVREMETAKQLTLCTSCMQMAKDIIEKHIPCYVTCMDIRHFYITLCLTKRQMQDAVFLKNLLNKVIDAVYKYFSINLSCVVGRTVFDPMALSESSYSARRFALKSSDAKAIYICDSEQSKVWNISDDLKLSSFKRKLTCAFEELDTKALFDTISYIVDSLNGDPNSRVQAMESASSLLYMAINLLPDGESTVEKLFSNELDGYRTLYRQTTTEGCCQWMEHLRDGLCQVLRDQRKIYKNRVVEDVKRYIKHNVNKRLTLNEVAASFNFSSNYLSQLFAKYAECGFVETVTKEKIAAAKAMMTKSDLKIYEIAEKLGYESAFYFSKVFKKETGQSPRDYIQSVRSTLP